jgi:hypothetical protein
MPRENSTALAPSEVKHVSDLGGLNTFANLILLIVLWFALFIGATLIVTLMLRGPKDLDFASRRFLRSVERLMESLEMNKLANMFTKQDERKQQNQMH